MNSANSVVGSNFMIKINFEWDLPIWARMKALTTAETVTMISLSFSCGKDCCNCGKNSLVYMNNIKCSFFSIVFCIFKCFLTCFYSIQISQYQVFAVHKLSHMMGWNVLSYSFASSSHQAQVFGTNPSILISSHDGAR